MDAARDPLLGTTLDHFRVLAPLGRGGMGHVYRAEDLDLWREVALKILPPSAATDPQRRARFLTEARSAAAIGHANIATIHEVGTAGDIAYIAMELVRGPTLRELLQDGMSRPRALSIALGIARGLAAAHDAGVLHCDLKPENVMVDRDGEPKLLDFGIARARLGESFSGRPATSPGGYSSQSDPAGSPDHPSGDIIGTPGYLSPEQARGIPLDPRSDVFALGIVCCEMLTGVRPFAAASAFEELLAVMHLDRPPAIPADLPPALAALLSRCLAPDPADRYRDGAELRDALAAVIDATRFDPIVRTPPAAPTHTADTLPAASPDSPPISRPSTPAITGRHTLGAGPTSFIGRDAELAEVLARFERGARLLVLVGPGGIGKTRLAREIARRVRDRDGRRAVAITLGTARTRSDVLQAAAGALGVALAPQLDASDALALALRSRGPALLVVDEAEPVAREVADLLPRWLEAAPQAQILVTSRERLRIPGEAVLELGPLTRAAGAALFIERARDARPDFAPGPATGAIAEQIAERLEGSPLAIELAAARVEVLSPPAILARLDDRLKVLSTRRTDRHGSLRAVIEWSWSLLDDDERAAMSQLSIFRGDFDAEAAEAVIALPAGRDRWAIDLVQSLRDKSLLRTAGAPGDEVRFVPYESVRLYAHERLAEQPEARRAAILRHAGFLAGRAWDAAERAVHGDDPTADRWLLRQREDLLAVADRALAGEGPGLDLAARCLAGLVWALHVRMSSEPVLERLDRVIARVDELPVDLQAHMLTLHAHVRAEATPPAARDTALHALAVARTAANPVLEVRAAHALAAAELANGDFARSEAAARDTVALARTTGVPFLFERSCHAIATALWRAGRAAEALETIRPAIDSARNRGARAILPSLLTIEGIILVQRGDHAGAERAYREALDLARAHDLHWLTPRVLNNLGVIAHEQDHLERARERYDEAIHMLARRGVPYVLGVALGNLAYVDCEEGALAGARARYDEAIAQLTTAGDRRFRATFLAGRAALAADQDRLDDAERDLAAATDLAAAVGEAAVITAVDVRRGHLDLARARAARDEPMRRQHRSALDARLAAFASSPGGPAQPDIVRMALRLLRVSVRRST